jgi:hypothetical protein
MWQLKTARILRDQSLRRNGDRPADHGKNFSALQLRALLVNSMLSSLLL